MGAYRNAVVWAAKKLGLVDEEWNPICAIYTPSDPEYWVFFCWHNPPPAPPEEHEDGRLD